MSKMGFLSDSLDELESHDSAKGHRVMRKLGMRPYGRLKDTTLHTLAELPPYYKTSDVSIKRLREKGEFNFELDVPHAFGIEPAGEVVAEWKARHLQRLLSELPKDFKEYGIFETKHGYHIQGRLPKGERQWRSMFAKYRRLFDGDFRDSGKNLGLRISPKVNITTGVVDSPEPKLIISTYRKRVPHKRDTQIYLTNP